MVSTAIRCGEIESVSRYNEEIGGDGNVVMEENDDNPMDSKKDE